LRHPIESQRRIGDLLALFSNVHGRTRPAR
jgi:hypothetical protein